jgi:DNA-binding transcriptional ArsR family regulator
MTPDTDTLSPDEAFDILSNRRRRYALHYLSDHPEGETLQELARQLAAWENEIEVEEVTKKQQKRVYVSLYQTHVPKLESAGVIEHDDDSGLLTLTGRADDVTTYLRDDTERTEDWYLYYFALVGASVVLMGLSILEVSVFAALSPALVGLVVVLAFGLLTGWYALIRYRESDGIAKQSV